MKISRLQAQNFKSFDSVDVELGDLNVFIGANASGKSNFLSILTFLRDIAQEGLEDAVSLQSGEIDLLRNVRIGREQTTTFQVDWGSGLEEPGQFPEAGWKAELESEMGVISGGRYAIELEYDNSDYRIATEQAGWGGYFASREEDSAKKGVFETKSFTRESAGELASSNGVFGSPSENPKTSLFKIESHELWVGFTRDVIARLREYDFGTLRSGTGISSQKGKTHLKEDGSNVAIVLRNLLKDEEKSRKFLNLVKVLLPFVEDVNVDRFSGQSLLVKLQESHSGDTYLPSSLLSDGTIKIIALLIALYFEDRWVAFEEPATSLHPKLISQLMQMMKEVSEDKQIFMTTHNPEVIRHVDLDDVYLVSRDEDGFSQVSKPNDSEVVHTFLENELGIDDLFVDDLLSL